MIVVASGIHYAAIFSIAGTWTAAAGTVTAVSLALWQNWKSRRDTAETAARVQADQVSAWCEEGLHDDLPGVGVVLSNSSSAPVCNVVVHLVFVQGGAPRTSEEMATHLRQAERASSYRSNFHECVINTLPPGRFVVRLEADYGIQGGAYPAAEISFTDARQSNWIRRSSGPLDKIQSNPIDYYGIVRPVNYMNLVRPQI